MEEKVSSNLRIVETFSYEDTYRLGQQLATQAVPCLLYTSDAADEL